MRRLTILRHAKSSWDHPGLADIDRPLNRRGEHDAPLMGRVCSSILPVPDLALASPSRRTRDTVRLFLEAWPGAGCPVMLEDGLYLAGRPDWLTAIEEYRDRTDHVLICGHQPGLGDLSAWLVDGFHEEIPTAAVLSITFQDGVPGHKSGTVSFFGCPRDYRG